VTGVEGWGTAAAQLYARNDKKTATQVVFVAPPSNSTLIQPILTAGRWLVPADENAIVIGNHLLKERPDLKVGDTVVTKINQRDYTWHIVGIYKLVGNVSPPLVYTNYEYLSRLKNETEQIWELRVITASHDLATQTRIAKQLEAAFKQAGLTVTGLQTGEDWRQSQTMTVDVLIYFLLVMAVLIAVVGGLGLMGTMSLNVLERTREIGVIRAIGASNPAVLQLVMAEGLLIGFISWVLGALLSIPITSLLDTGVGLAVMTAPMTFTLGWDGLVIWLAGVLIIAALASALPAWNAMQLTVREVLAYE
jgi:putative ABC transport system permease protein